MGAACRHNGLHITLNVKVMDPKKQFASAVDGDQLDSETKRLLEKYTGMLQKLMALMAKCGDEDSAKKEQLNAKVIKVE